MSHRLALEAIEPITHDTNRLVFEKPDGFSFTPGQATDLALMKDGWEDEERPFTFTSLPTQAQLEFTIKSYPSHDGVTEQIANMRPGDEVRIGEPWGAISDQGPGVILAAGAGITPFLAILRQQVQETGNLTGYTLVFSNKRERDVILRDELTEMPGLKVELLLSEERAEGAAHGHIDRQYLDDRQFSLNQPFYVCGPPEMESAVAEALTSLGLPQELLVRESD